MKCKYCGYDNNDGSQICLHCGKKLEKSSGQISDAEKYIYAKQEAISKVETSVRQAGKNTAIVSIIVIVAIVLGAVIYFANLYKPVVDENLLGSWQSTGYGYTDVWTFEKDGTYSMVRTGTGIFTDGLDVDDWHYKAEDGRLKTSWSKNIDEYVSAIYEYQFGVSADGRKCLILKTINSGGGSTTEVLHKVH